MRGVKKKEKGEAVDDPWRRVGFLFSLMSLVRFFELWGWADLG